MVQQPDIAAEAPETLENPGIQEGGDIQEGPDTTGPKLKSLGSLKQLGKFSVVGVSNTVISYVVYAICVFFGCQYVVANIIGFAAGVINSFIWNNRYVFTVKEGERRNSGAALVKTAIVNVFTGLLVANGLLVLWVEVVGLSEYIGPILNLFITFPLNFLLNKYWAYRKVTEEVTEE